MRPSCRGAACRALPRPRPATATPYCAKQVWPRNPQPAIMQRRHTHARMAELADAEVSKTSFERSVGSSPTSGTNGYTNPLSPGGFLFGRSRRDSNPRGRHMPAGMCRGGAPERRAARRAPPQAARRVPLRAPMVTLTPYLQGVFFLVDRAGTRTREGGTCPLACAGAERLKGAQPVERRHRRRGESHFGHQSFRPPCLQGVFLCATSQELAGPWTSLRYGRRRTQRPAPPATAPAGRGWWQAPRPSW